MPLQMDYDLDSQEFNTHKYPSELYKFDLQKWREAEKKVLFEGFKERKWEGGIVYDNDELDIFIDISEHKTLQDLAEETQGILTLKTK
jgi:hypothetical protein